MSLLGRISVKRTRELGGTVFDMRPRLCALLEHVGPLRKADSVVLMQGVGSGEG